MDFRIPGLLTRSSGYSAGEMKCTLLLSAVRRFLMSEDGPTAVEYAVLVGLIVVGIVARCPRSSTSISGTFSTVSSTITPS